MVYEFNILGLDSLLANSICIQNMNKIPKSQSPFEQLQEVDADGKEWWNSRKLARVMGYGKYWNFERVIAKAQAWTTQKEYQYGEHFVEITEMVEQFGIDVCIVNYRLITYR